MLGVFAKIQPELCASITGDVGTAAPTEDEEHQLPDLENIALPADALRGDLIPFEEHGVAPVDHLEAITFTIPEQVLGVYVVVDDLFAVCVFEQAEQVIKDDQHFEFGQALPLPGKFEHFVLDDDTLGAFHDDVLVIGSADEELPAAEIFSSDRVIFEAHQRLTFRHDADLLPGTDGRGIVESRAFNHNRTVILLCVLGTKRLATASAWVNVVVPIPIVKKTIRHYVCSPQVGL